MFVVSSLTAPHLLLPVVFVSQLVYEARAIKLCPCAKIKVRNVRFLDCHADYFPHTPTGIFFFFFFALSYGSRPY